MYKVFLVEDEPLILEGLRETVPWEEYGCAVVGEANDALTAEQGILRLRPDIVLTDIQMPGVSGLELIERVQGSVPCEFIIISGYDQFEYAQRAVYLGVKGYLLKPIDDAEFRDVMQRTVRSLQTGGAADSAILPQTDASAGERYLEKARVILERRCGEELTLRTVADELGISESYLGKLMKSNAGYTFLELLTLYRMKKAVRLLGETDLKIYEIAEQTGYRDAKYFSEVFSRVVGVTPMKFKNGYKLAAHHILNRI